ncbi:hypothetical protein PFISCL1PPCAC_7456, partial [Pristionchus fissidentatus]
IRLLWLLSFYVTCSRAVPVTVNTSRGLLQGFDHDFGADKSKPFYGYGQVFLGIPYAKAPLGERRFTLPEDICQYTENGAVHDATYYRPRCYQVQDILQPASNMAEDCLYLNVVTPDVNGSYPVMFYIHGGTLTTGGADVYHWKGTIRNLVSRGVVVVTIQYRVGLIGFFTTYTEKFPPNRGIFDQILALKWVNEEIENFGGDPSRITIFGQSAGAMSVSHHSSSPLAKGLFQQILQTSGAALSEIETPEDPRGSIHKERARQVCNIDDSNWGTSGKDDALMKCLLAATPEQIIEYDFSTSKSWQPTLDGAFLPDYPANLAKQRPHFPVLMIDMLEESAMFVPGMTDNDVSGIGPDTAKNMFADAWPNYDSDEIDLLNDFFITGYSNGVVPDDDDHFGWAKLATAIDTGRVFDANMVTDLKWHQANGNNQLWLFTFAHRHKLSVPIEVQGWIPVSHCAELPFVWFYPEIWDNSSVTVTADDFTVADHMGKIWTDFAKNGKLDYEKAGPNRNYLEIDKELTKGQNWRAPSDEVFNKKVPQVVGEFPPLTISKESWNMLNELGSKTLNKWNSAQCSNMATTTQSASTIAVLISICFLATMYL